MLNAERRARAAAELVDPDAIGLEQLCDRSCGGDRLGRGLVDSFEKESKPCFPFAVVTNTLQEVVIFLAMVLEIEAEIEHGLFQYPFDTEHEGNQQPSQAAVAIQKWVNGLELNVRERRLDQDRQLDRPIVEKILERAQCLPNFVSN